MNSTDQLHEDVQQIQELRRSWKRDRDLCKQLTLKVVSRLSKRGLSCREIASELGVSGQYVAILLRDD